MVDIAVIAAIAACARFEHSRVTRLLMHAAAGVDCKPDGAASANPRPFA